MARKEAPTAAASRESRERRVASSSSNNNFSSIRNFRPVSSFKETKIYRCGSTDVLGAKLRCLSETETETKTKTTETNRSWSEADTMVLEDAGLVLDLRSPPERREDDAQRWMNMNKGLLSLLSRDGGGGGSSNSSSNSNSGGNCCTSTTRQPRRRRRPIRLVTIPLEASASVSRDGAIASEDIFGRNNYNNSNVGEDSRYVIRLDVLNRSELLGYVRKKWLSPGLTAASSILVSPAEASPPPVSSAASMPTSTSAAASPFTYRIEEANKIMTELNRRGLAGLNEAILETRSGQKGMCLALQLMTLYREAVVARADSETKRSTRSSNDDECNKHETTTQNNHSIVFHCVQGKDRTGMLAMLMQLLVGCSDEVIVEDYYRSNAEFVVGGVSASSSNETSSSAAASAMVARRDNNVPNNNNNRTTIVLMDGSVFRGTNRPAMVATLKGLRFRHGRSLEGYFDRIGFDDSWRKRFVAVFGDAATIDERGGGEFIPPSSRL